jgi:hypothetical protein
MIDMASEQVSRDDKLGRSSINGLCNVNAMQIRRKGRLVAKGKKSHPFPANSVALR